jgi:TPR repeat protein
VNVARDACYRVAVRPAVFVFLSLAAACSPSTTRSAGGDIVRSAKIDCAEGNTQACEVQCSDNVASACNEAGRSYELGNGVARSGVAANTFYRKACDLGDATGCYNAAYLLEHGLAGRRDAGCALALYRRACDGSNHAASCLNAGMIWKAGDEEVPRDEERARAAFERACAAGHNGACAELKKQ